MKTKDLCSVLALVLIVAILSFRLGTIKEKREWFYLITNNEVIFIDPSDELVDKINDSFVEPNY